VHYFFVGKKDFTGGFFDMAGAQAIHRPGVIVRNLVYIDMAAAATDASMRATAEYLLVHIEQAIVSIFIHTSKPSKAVAHEAVVGIRGIERLWDSGCNCQCKDKHRKGTVPRKVRPAAIKVLFFGYRKILHLGFSLIMTCFTDIILMGSKPMVRRVFWLCANGTRIGIREQALLMGIMATVTNDAAVLVQRDFPRDFLHGTNVFRELIQGHGHLRLYLVGIHISQHIRQRD